MNRNKPTKLDAVSDAISTMALLVLGVTFILVFLFGMSLFESFLSVLAFGIVVTLFSLGGGGR